MFRKLLLSLASAGILYLFQLFLVGPAFAQTIERNEVMAASGIVGGDRGSYWGPHNNKITRLTNGDIFAAVTEGTSGTLGPHFAHVFKRSHATGTWSDVFNTGTTDIGPPCNLLRDLNNQLFLVCEGVAGPPAPFYYTSSDAGVTWSSSTSIPNTAGTDVGTTYNPYTGATVGSDGTVYYWGERDPGGHATGCDFNPGEFVISKRTPSGTWSASPPNVQPLIRNTYPTLNVVAGSELAYWQVQAEQYTHMNTTCGTSTYNWSACGCGDTFAFFKANIWHTLNAGVTSATSVTGLENDQANATTNRVEAWPLTSYLDNSGRLHTVIEDQPNGNTTWTHRHFYATESSSGSGTWTVNATSNDLDTGGPNGNKYTWQDSSNTFWFFGSNQFSNVVTTWKGAAGDTDGTSLNAQVNLSLAGRTDPGELGWCATERSGTRQFTNFIDCWKGDSPDSQADYYRVRLNGNSEPTLTSISPTSGPAGSVITLTGTNMSPSKQVSFTLTPVTATVVNSTTVTAAVPASLSIGTAYNVTVDGLDGTTGIQTFTVTGPNAAGNGGGGPNGGTAAATLTS